MTFQVRNDSDKKSLRKLCVSFRDNIYYCFFSQLIYMVLSTNQYKGLLKFHGQVWTRQQVIKTDGYYFENLTGWLPAFDAFVMVRSREMITKDIVIKIKALWALLQGDIGRQRPTTIKLLILNSSKRYYFDCRTTTRIDREKLKTVLRPWEQEL